MKNNYWQPLLTGLLLSAMLGLSLPINAVESQDKALQEEPQKGPHNGRLLIEGEFVVELAIFEAGVPPEFRVWVTQQGQPVKPEEVALTVVLTRLGNVEDHISFSPQDDFLRGSLEIYEPHSFVVTIKAEYRGKRFSWQYDNFEGRTKIGQEIADAMDIKTAIAGPATLVETAKVYGKLETPVDAQRSIRARFEGQIENVHVSLGQTVARGELLLTIQSNESLKSYKVVSPIDGVVSDRNANPGEQTAERLLLTVTDNRTLIAELSVFPMDRHRVKKGAQVLLSANDNSVTATGVIDAIDTRTQANQSTVMRVTIDNQKGLLMPGLFVTADIAVAEYAVPQAVKRSGLQSFRDFTVVYAKIGEEYEVRMLELGRIAGQWIEVLGGLPTGTEYVTENSYVIKADIEKSGASHDH
ncbi:MAG: cobalt-zinc-cadmium efflux system membrane fusion protein [Halioglobus sp.]|jgi:cobalt-zinc-cadmium efflux system membrane fusion protein